MCFCLRGLGFRVFLGFRRPLSDRWCRILVSRLQGAFFGSFFVMFLGSCQNYGPFWCTLYRCRIIIASQKGTLILTTTLLIKNGFQESCHNRVEVNLKNMWEFPKIRGYIVLGPYNKDPTILGYSIRVRYFRKPPC